jgi:hypothetical protein
MKTLRVCDICKGTIESFEELREIQLFKRESWDCVIDTIWEYELCLPCSLKIEQEIKRRIKIKTEQ